MTNQPSEERACAQRMQGWVREVCALPENNPIHSKLGRASAYHPFTPAPSDEPKPDPCGYFCTATWDRLGMTPKNNLPPCEHGKERHYSIDGDATGCIDCEEIAELTAEPKDAGKGEPTCWYADAEWHIKEVRLGKSDCKLAHNVPTPPVKDEGFEDTPESYMRMHVGRCGGNCKLQSTHWAIEEIDRLRARCSTAPLDVRKAAERIAWRIYPRVEFEALLAGADHFPPTFEKKLTDDIADELSAIVEGK